MIIPSMTYKEMYDHLAGDLKKVEYRKDYYLPKAIRFFRKIRKFPSWKWYEYKVPETNNKYIICYYAENSNCVENPKVVYFVDLFFDRKRFVVKWMASPYKHTNESHFILLRQIHAYSSHFLHRYNERFLKDDTLTANDIACRYLSRNDVPVQIEITEEINKNIEQYGEGGKQGFIVQDGICFAQTSFQGLQSEDGNRNNDKVDAMAIVYTTFIPEYMMTDGQQFAIEKEHQEKWKQAFMDYMKESNGGILRLRLEP